MKPSFQFLTFRIALGSEWECLEGEGDSLAVGGDVWLRGGGGEAKGAIGNFMQNNEPSQTVASTNDLPTFSRVQTRQYLAKNSREILSC
jgi:hypothetical protein